MSPKARGPSWPSDTGTPAGDELPGAVAPARFVGGTTSGAPTTGTFAAGDFVVDQSGTIWICTLGGSPGTWVDLSSGKELAYAEATATQTISGNTVTDLTGLSVTFTARSRPVLVVAYCMGVLNNTATAVTSNLSITDDLNNTKQIAKCYTPASLVSAEVMARYRYSPVAGTAYTFKARWTGGSAGANVTLQGGATFPMHIHAVEC